MVGGGGGGVAPYVGVGGGVLIVPALTSCQGVAQKVVSGTSLVAVLATSAISTTQYVRTDAVDVPAAAIVAATAVLSAPAGARATTVLSQSALKKCLGAFLCAAAPLVPAKHYWFRQKSQGEGGAAEQRQPMDASRVALLAATGCIAGFASGLLGIGGGTVVSPVLALFTDLPQVSAVATSLAAMFVPSAVALATHHQLGNVRPRMGAVLAVGTAAGAFVGARCAINAPDGALEGAFGGGMAFLGLRTLLKS